MCSRRLFDSDQRFSLFIAGALVLHALLAALLARIPDQRRQTESGASVPVFVELERKPAPAPEAPRSAHRVPTRGAEPSGELERSQGHPSAAPARIPGHQSAALAGSGVIRPPQPPVLEAPAADTDIATGSDTKSPPSRRLSLDQLGLGDSSPLIARGRFLPERRRGGRAGPVPEAEAEMALQENMAQERLVEDQRLGLGPEGPVLAEIVKLSRAQTSAPNTDARLDVTTNAEGFVVEVRLIDSTTDARAWSRIASELLARLSRTKLRTPGQGQGATFRIKVRVRAQLPSGADPGLADPRAIGDPERGGVVSILSLRGDLVDIGALVQKVARAHVESIRVTPRIPKH